MRMTEGLQRLTSGKTPHGADPTTTVALWSVAAEAFQSLDQWKDLPEIRRKDVVLALTAATWKVTEGLKAQPSRDDGVMLRWLRLCFDTQSRVIDLWPDTPGFWRLYALSCLNLGLRLPRKEARPLALGVAERTLKAANRLPELQANAEIWTLSLELLSAADQHARVVTEGESILLRFPTVSVRYQLALSYGILGLLRHSAADASKEAQHQGWLKANAPEMYKVLEKNVLLRGSAILAETLAQPRR